MCLFFDAVYERIWRHFGGSALSAVFGDTKCSNA